MSEANNRTKVADTFRGWMNGTSYITDLLADDIKWEIVGNSVAPKRYGNKQQFIDEVLPLRRTVQYGISSNVHPRYIRG